MLGSFFNCATEVTLRIPPPLDEYLEVNTNDSNKILLLNGKTVVAEARPANVKLDIPQPPRYEEAVEFSKNYIGFEHHYYPTCFVCGPQREHGSGLRIFPGQIPGKNMVAAPWIPDASLANDDGFIKPEIIWSCLDCPGAFAILTLGLRMMLLGKLAVKIENHIKPGDKCVVIGWPISTEGRKLHAGTALFSESGTLCAMAKATWIELKN